MKARLNTTNFYFSQTIREIEQAAMQALQIPEYELMQRAARAALNAALQRWPKAQRIAIFCGSGNNGGDGYELGAQALRLGLSVRLVALKTPKTETAQHAKKAFLEAGGEVKAWQKGVSVDSADVIIDALLGTGLERAPKGSYGKAIKAINAGACPVLALDVPSGLNADSGQLPGSCVVADLTITFVGRKPGLHTAKGVDMAGEVRFDALGIPDVIYASFPADAASISATKIRQILTPLAPGAHKGSQGRLLIAGGQPGMLGAMLLAGKSACRVGAGLVEVLSHAYHAALISVSVPELLVQAVNENGRLPEFDTTPQAILLGCGLGQGGWGKQLFDAVLEPGIKENVPMVLDADGLNWLSQHPQRYANWILTPHPKEAARLLKTTVEKVQADRFSAATEIAQRYGGVCVLKGAGTIITAAGEKPLRPVLNTCGNPGLATGGTGDVLAGMIAGLMAQGIAPLEAAKAGVWLHGSAADEVAEKRSQRGLMAMDLVEQLGYILRRFEPQ